MLIFTSNVEVMVDILGLRFKSMAYDLCRGSVEWVTQITRNGPEMMKQEATCKAVAFHFGKELTECLLQCIKPVKQGTI